MTGAMSLTSIDSKYDPYEDGLEHSTAESTAESTTESTAGSTTDADHLSTTEMSYRGVRVEQEKLITTEPLNLSDNLASGAMQQYSVEPKNAVGAYNLGLLHAQGMVVQQDKVKAAEFFAKAHAAGYVKATYNLGLLYQRGEGVEQNSAKAAELYELAHDKGYSKATYNLGKMYERGEGVEQDSVMAAELFEQLTKGKTDVFSLKKRLKKSVVKPVLAFQVYDRNI